MEVVQLLQSLTEQQTLYWMLMWTGIFWKSFSIKFGQGKLPGNRERVISSGNLQLVDRSRLNSRYNIDRDVGFTLSNWTKLGKQFFIKEVAAVFAR